jgi:hypothetical protein
MIISRQTLTPPKPAQTRTGVIREEPHKRVVGRVLDRIDDIDDRCHGDGEPQHIDVVKQIKPANTI